MARNVPHGLTNRVEPSWRAREISVKKFVDDNLQNEKLLMKDIPTLENNQQATRNARAGKSEIMFNHISRNANKQGLLVNAQKTTILTVSAATSYIAKSHIYDHSMTRIDCTDTLKTLGFVFNKQADVSTQVDVLCKRFRSRTWALRILRKADFTHQELVAVYKSTIRPVIEYSSVIYHPMLTAEQAAHIEKQQTRALKNIFGNEYSQKRLLELANLPTLEQRREEACVRFARKMSQNPRFEHHFRKKRSRARALVDEEFVEQQARTNRRKNSPLYYYRRILNDKNVHFD